MGCFALILDFEEELTAALQAIRENMQAAAHRPKKVIAIMHGHMQGIIAVGAINGKESCKLLRVEAAAIVRNADSQHFIIAVVANLDLGIGPVSQ